MPLSKRELSTTLRRLAKAHSEAFRLGQIIDKHSIEVYGKRPSDIDNDAFIDTCGGGSGESSGMSADEFHQSMIDALSVNQRTV